VRLRSGDENDPSTTRQLQYKEDEFQLLVHQVHCSRANARAIVNGIQPSFPTNLPLKSFAEAVTTTTPVLIDPASFERIEMMPLASLHQHHLLLLPPTHPRLCLRLRLHPHLPESRRMYLLRRS
jgi:hypothetical protein